MRTEIELNNGWRFAKIYDLGISENDAVTPNLTIAHGKRSACLTLLMQLIV